MVGEGKDRTIGSKVGNEAPFEDPGAPWATWRPRSKSNGLLEQEGLPKPRANGILLETAVGPLEPAWAPD